MAHTAYPTLNSGDAWTASQANTYWRDNDLQYFPYTTAGDMQYASSSSATTRLAIGSNYQVIRSNASVPSWQNVIEFCQVYNSTTQSFTTGSTANITWNSEVSDLKGWHSTSSNTDRITVAEAGVYIPFVKIHWTKDSGGAGNFYLTSAVSLNGTNTVNFVTVYDAIDANTKQFTYGGQPVSATAGQYFAVNFKQDSGGTGTLYGTNSTTSNFTLLRIA